MAETVLVTGGTGFVGSHCIVQLLNQGYQVKTTLRSLDRKNEALEMQTLGGITSFENLEFIQADLTREDNWDLAANGCHYALHVASPINLEVRRDENDFIVPADLHS